MDNKTIEIFVSVAYKALMERSVKDGQDVTPALLETHTKVLIDVTNKLSGHVEPFSSRPANVPRGEKYVGMPCPECQTPLVAGQNGKPYCKTCYKKWAAINKPR